MVVNCSTLVTFSRPLEIYLKFLKSKIKVGVNYNDWQYFKQTIVHLMIILCFRSDDLINSIQKVSKDFERFIGDFKDYTVF